MSKNLFDHFRRDVSNNTRRISVDEEIMHSKIIVSTITSLAKATKHLSKTCKTYTLNGLEPWRNPTPDGWGFEEASEFRNRFFNWCSHRENLPRAERRVQALCERLFSAIDVMVASNLGLVAKVAFSIPSPHVAFLDRVQEGSIGLFKAAWRFDWRRGHKFSTYAMWWIRQGVLKSTTKWYQVHLPSQVRKELTQVREARIALRQELGREPTDSEIANHLLGDPNAQITSKHYFEPLEDLSADSDAMQLIDRLALEDTSEFLPGERDQLRRIVRDSVDRLTEQQSRVLKLRFGLEDGRTRTLKEIGYLMNLSRERIRQIEAIAFKALSSRVRHPQLATLRRNSTVIEQDSDESNSDADTSTVH